LVTYAYLADVTKNLGLTTGVIILPQRQTALFAKQAADVDLFSDGRLRLGVGVGAVESDAGKCGCQIRASQGLLSVVWPGLFAVADAVDAGLDLFLYRLGDGRRDLGGDHHRVGDFGAR
jgi:hypothetical protein